MGLDPDSVGRRGATTTMTWTARDAALYALGIGAGHDPEDAVELPFVREEAAYPMMALALGVAGADRPSFGGIDRARFVHSAQVLRMHRPLPLEGTVTLDCDIVGINEVGSGGLVSWRTSGAHGGQALFSMVATGFLIGGGGFGGERPPADEWSEPEGVPDTVLKLPTSSQQALVYRLSGDRNPLHSDPDTARRGGFERPILHGLSLLGAVARVLLRSRVQGLRLLRARFTAPVYPGETIMVHAWGDPTDERVAFRAFGPSGRMVLDRGEVVVG